MNVLKFAEALGQIIFKTVLKKLIETGKGEPNATGKPQTENEKKLSKN